MAFEQHNKSGRTEIGLFVEPGQTLEDWQVYFSREPAGGWVLQDSCIWEKWVSVMQESRLGDGGEWGWTLDKGQVRYYWQWKRSQVSAEMWRGVCSWDLTPGLNPLQTSSRALSPHTRPPGIAAVNTEEPEAACLLLYFLTCVRSVSSLPSFPPPLPLCSSLQAMNFGHLRNTAFWSI